MSFNANEMLVLALIQLLLLIILFFIFVYFLKKVKHKIKIALLGMLFVNFIVIPFLTGSNQKLITDEQMLVHFNEHRHEIETLMHEYLTNPEEWGSFRNASPELKAIQQNSLVDEMARRYNHWHENPYSLEAAKKHTQYISSRPVTDGSTQDVRVSLTVKDARIFYKRRSKTAYKQFMYIPQVAKVENGKLLYPVSAIHPERINFRVILESLDQVPSWLLPGDCTMKRIDEHWFLALCLTS